MAYGGSTNTDILSEKTFDILCRICEREGKHKEAGKYCEMCRDYYCLKCVKYHEYFPSLFGHKILDISQFPSGPSKAQLSAKQGSITTQSSAKQGTSMSHCMGPTERCDKHSHLYVNMYCQTHDDVGCSTCMELDHRSCQGIVYIQEFVQHNSSASASREVHQMLESVSKTLKDHHEQILCEKRGLQSQKEQSIKDIRKFRKEIDDTLDELEKKAVADIEEIYKTLMEKIEEGMKHLDDNKAYVSSAKDKLLPPDNNVPQNFVNVKKGKIIAGRVEKCLIDNESLFKTPDIGFVPDQRISALLEEIKALGKTSNVNNQEKRVLQIKDIKEYSVIVQSDSKYFSCDIVSACILENGAIILSDNKNKRLKRLYSPTFSVRDVCDLPAQPWQVCSAGKHQVAVCLTTMKEVYFIEVKEHMTITSKITTEFECYGLAYGQGNLYISDSETSVYIYSLSGKKLKQFSKDQSGEILFSDIQSLSFNENGSRLYITDWNKGLVVLDSNGQVVGKFNGSLLKGACGSYLTGGGDLLLCCYYSYNVVQFGQNGELIREVVKSDCINQAICYNEQMSKMIIGRHSGYIDVYDTDLC